MSCRPAFNCLKFSMGLLFLLMLQQAYGQFNFTDLNQTLDAKKKVLGDDFVVMVYKDDTLAYKKEVGELKTRTQAPLESCSKWLTAALVMTFVDEGKISLDDKVSRYIPAFEKYGKNYITIRHCLSHMTGIQTEQAKVLKLFERKKFSSLEDEVNAFAAKEIQTNPGTEFRYSNMGFNIAGRILEIITKKKFDNLMRQRIFVLSGMRNSTFSTLDGGAIDPSAGGMSTANDYMNFLVMLLHNGMFNGKRVLSEESVKQLRTLQAPADLIKDAPKAVSGYDYSLGAWAMEPDHDGKASILTNPGLPGSWPMIDYCRGYAYLFFTKKSSGEEKAEVQMGIKTLLEDKFKRNCK